MRAATCLSIALVLVMVAQASLGLLFDTSYRDVDWVKATWFGNDWVTLVLAVPLLAIGLLRSTAGSIRGLLVWMGLVGYALYNYAFYVFGAALNAFFPIYVVAVVLAGSILILSLSHLDAREVANRFHPAAPVRLIGGSLLFIGIGLASVWIALWAAYAFADRPTPVEPDVFRLVAALDLCLMVPALGSGGLLIWQRSPWGYVISAIASIQGALYVVVLSVNSVVAVQRGLTAPPGELPAWAALTVFTAAIAFVVLANVRPSRGMNPI